MGGCATKPKVLKGGDEGEVPDPGTPRVAVSAGNVVVADADVSKEKDVIDDNNVGDESNKESRSLSNLFNKEKEKDVTTESDNTPSEALKQQLGEPSKTEAVTVNQETKEPEKPMEPGSGFPGDIGLDQPIEAKWAPEAGAVTVTETKSKEASAGEKKDKAVVEN